MLISLAFLGFWLWFVCVLISINLRSTRIWIALTLEILKYWNLNWIFRWRKKKVKKLRAAFLFELSCSLFMLPNLSNIQFSRRKSRFLLQLKVNEAFNDQNLGTSAANESIISSQPLCSHSDFTFCSSSDW